MFCMVHCLHIWTGHFATLRKRQKQKQPKINYRAGPGRLSRTKVAGGPLVGARFVSACQSVQKKLSKVDAPKATKSKSDAEVFGRIVDYLESHLTTHITIDLICKDNLIGRSQLQKIFKEHCNLGIIEYFSILKINAAKELTRTNRMNFTQIAEHLGYASIHYFSRQFKKVVGMTPSEYASSIKAMAEGQFSDNADS